MVDWNDLMDPRRKLPAAIRQGAIHALKSNFTLEGYPAYCGEIFDYEENLILLQKLEDISCPVCHEIVEARLSFNNKVDRPIAVADIEKCPKCGGHLYADREGELHCLCGKVVYTK